MSFYDEMDQVEETLDSKDDFQPALIRHEFHPVEQMPGADYTSLLSGRYGCIPYVALTDLLADNFSLGHNEFDAVSDTETRRSPRLLGKGKAKVQTAPSIKKEDSHRAQSASSPVTIVKEEQLSPTPNKAPGNDMVSINSLPLQRKRKRAASSHQSPTTEGSIDEDQVEDQSSLPVLRVGDREQMSDFYEKTFSLLQGLALKNILKAWIKELEPKKSRNHPYCKSKGSRPAFWPDDIEHKEPDHLKKARKNHQAHCQICPS